MRNLTTITARLQSLGFGSLLERLQAGPLIQTECFYFSSIKMAKTAQRLLYNWLWFFPAIKDYTAMRLLDETATLSIMPRFRREKRGRKKIS